MITFSRPVISAELVLDVSGFKTFDGAVMISVFNDKKSWLTEQTTARASVAVADLIKDGIVTVAMELEPDDYAVLLFQDVNNNGDLDTRKLIPIPTEPIGLSNNKPSRLGPPKYKHALFTHSAEGTRLHITLK